MWAASSNHNPYAGQNTPPPNQLSGILARWFEYTPPTSLLEPYSLIKTTNQLSSTLARWFEYKTRIRKATFSCFSSETRPTSWPAVYLHLIFILKSPYVQFALSSLFLLDIWTYSCLLRVHNMNTWLDICNLKKIFFLFWDEFFFT